LAGSRERRRVKTEESPREPIAQAAQGKHGQFSHVIASSSTVFCSTGTILRRNGNGRGRVFEQKKSASQEPWTRLEFAAEGTMEHGLEEGVKALSIGGLLGVQLMDFRDPIRELLLNW
jgi:hypothetical protein